MSNAELASILYSAGFILVLAGVLILAVNMLFRKTSGGAKGRGEVGGVILIGPFPIVFGTSGRMMKIMFALAFLFIAVILLVTFFHS
jgi:uncharacterized protein (TIGR00304 family)